MEHGRAMCHIWSCINNTHAFVLMDVRVRFWILAIAFHVCWTSICLRWFRALVPSNPSVYILYSSDSWARLQSWHRAVGFNSGLSRQICPKQTVGCIQNNSFISTHNLINPARRKIMAILGKILLVWYTRWAWRVYSRGGTDQHLWRATVQEGKVWWHP